MVSGYFNGWVQDCRNPSALGMESLQPCTSKPQIYRYIGDLVSHLNMMTSSNGSIFRVNGPYKGQWRGDLTFSLMCACINGWVKGQWRGDLIFSLMCVCINGWVNNRKAVDLRRHRANYYVTVMKYRLENVTFGVSKFWFKHKLPNCFLSFYHHVR